MAQFPQAEVVAMLKRPGYSRLALTDRLRRFLDRRVSGAEPPEQLVELVVAWVERRLAEQPAPPAPSRLATSVRNAWPLVSAAGVVAIQNPAVREVLVRQMTKARDKTRGWLERLVPPQERPKS